MRRTPGLTIEYAKFSIIAHLGQLSCVQNKRLSTEHKYLFDLSVVKKRKLISWWIAMRTLICLLIFYTLGVSASAEINTHHAIIGVATVIDGDTIKINGNNIRLNGIDAPERRQSCTYQGSDWLCGQKATLALADLISQKPVTCQVSGRDRYRRSIAICFIGRLDLNAWMVEQGWAVANRKYLTDYVMQEDEARQEKRGIWKGEFVMPWDWRAQKKKR